LFFNKFYNHCLLSGPENKQYTIIFSEGLGGGGLNQFQSSVQQDINVVRNSNGQVTEQLVTQNGVNTASYSSQP
jgi:hypothetical protein